MEKVISLLLLGGTGTLSRSVRKLSVAEGYKVSIFNRGHLNKEVEPEVEILIGDFFDKDILNSIATRNFDIVIDFLSRKKEDIERVFPIFKNRCKQYIFISSACVYERDAKDLPIKETASMPNKNWIYSKEKYECENTLMFLAKESKTCFSIIRPYITYDERRIPIGIAPDYEFHHTIIQRILHDKPMFIWNGGETITTVTYVDDFAKGVIGLFLNPKAYGEAFHITSDYSYSIKEVLILLYQKLGKKPNIVDIPIKTLIEVMPNYKGMLVADRALDALFDNSKIKEAVPGLQFSVNLDKGLEYILDYYGTRGPFKYDYKFEAQLDRLMMREGISTKYISYPNLQKTQRLIYYLFKYLPYKYAIRIANFFFL